MDKGQGYFLPKKHKKINIIIFFGYLIIGIYFINYPFDFFEIPALISGFDSWIIFVAGLLMLFGALNYFRVKRR